MCLDTLLNLEYWLHIVTIIGLMFTVLGALYLAYDLLDRPHGLRWLLWSVIAGLVGVMVTFPLSVFFLRILQFSKQIESIYNCTYLGFSWIRVAGDFAIFGCMVGLFLGLFTPPLPSDAGDASESITLYDANNRIIRSVSPSNTRKKGILLDVAGNGLDKQRIFSLKNCRTGLLCGFMLWFIDIFLIFPTPQYFNPDFVIGLPDSLQFALIGAVGGGFWQWYRDELLHELPAKKGESFLEFFFIKVPNSMINILHRFRRTKQAGLLSIERQSIFSLREFIDGLFYWAGVVFLSSVIWFFITWIMKEWWFPDDIDLTVNMGYVIGETIAATLAGGVIGGISSSIYRRINAMERKKLGMLGVRFTVVGFTVLLVEPIVLAVHSSLP